MRPKYTYDSGSKVLWKTGQGTASQLSRIMRWHTKECISPRIVNDGILWACTCAWFLDKEVAIGMSRDFEVFAIGSVAFVLDEVIVPPSTVIRMKRVRPGYRPVVTRKRKCSSLVCTPTTLAHTALDAPTSNVFYMKRNGLVYCAPCTNSTWVCGGCLGHFRTLRDLAHHQGDLPPGDYIPMFSVKGMPTKVVPAGRYTPDFQKPKEWPTKNGRSQQITAQLWSRLLGLGGVL